MSIGTVLDTNGYNVKFVDYSLELTNSGRLIDLINKYQPIYVSVSSYTEKIELCKYIRKNFKNLPILLGDPHPTVDSEYCKNN